MIFAAAVVPVSAYTLRTEVKKIDSLETAAYYCIQVTLLGCRTTDDPTAERGVAFARRVLSSRLHQQRLLPSVHGLAAMRSKGHLAGVFGKSSPPPRAHMARLAVQLSKYY